MPNKTQQELVRRARALNDRQMQYVLWASVSPEMREPRTIAEFADLVGVSPQMVNRWSKDPRIMTAIRMLVLSHASDPGRISAALDFLYDAFQDDNLHMKDRLSAVKMWLDTVGVSQTFKQESDLAAAQMHQELDLSSMSEADLRNLLENNPEDTDRKIRIISDTDDPQYISDLRETDVDDMFQQERKQLRERNG
jgi:hypothetical protein